MAACVLFLQELPDDAFSSSSHNEQLSLMKDNPIRIAILGSTGSIGTQTLEIISQYPDRFRAVVLAAGANIDKLEAQIRKYQPECAALFDSSKAKELSKRLGRTILDGAQGVLEAAKWPEVDIVVTAMVGSAGLLPTIAAIKSGRRIALANKETMVVAGDLIGVLAQQYGSEIVPVDSEHSAIYQCLIGEPENAVDRLIITASGGPFRDRPIETFKDITLAEALNHPNWNMGSKITIDSATMMNKGLEVIEARWLFDIVETKIDVVIHPQSIIHSMVQFSDGSTKAQLGPPDMKVPIQYALTSPERWTADHPTVDWSKTQSLTFDPPSPDRFPNLKLAFEALEIGGGMPAVLNAANEEAVSLFLNEKINFNRISSLIESVMQRIEPEAANSIEERLDIDLEARALAKELAGVDVN